MRTPNESSMLLPIVFAVIVASFTAATAFKQWQLSAVRTGSSEIADRIAPDIERLATARGEMRRVQLSLREYVDDERAGAPTTRHSVERARHDMDAALAAYPAAPQSIVSAKAALDDAIERDLETSERHDFVAESRCAREVTASADVLSLAITREIAENAARSHGYAVDIEHVYARSRLVAYALAIVVAAITVLGAVAIRRAMRAHAELHARHRALVEARASELEEFAGRVAHDIMSPLSVIAMSLKLASRVDDVKRAEILERGTRSIDRIDRLVAGLLSFAVAGARPEEGAHANVAETISDVASELRPAAVAAGCELVVAVDVTSPAACHEGVLTSLVSNLVRNAIKYSAGCAMRRIEVHASETRQSIRIEVSDTGPGLPAEIAAHVFDPYVRGKNSTQGSIGLGLATVKRLATAHGGTVAVDSRPGEGCKFVVELPKGAAHAAPALERATA